MNDFTGYLPGSISDKMISYNDVNFTRYTSSQIFAPLSGNKKFVSASPSVGMILSELINSDK